MVYPVSCTAGCYVTIITLFIKKVGVVRPNFGGPDSPDPPVVAPLISQLIIDSNTSKEDPNDILLVFSNTNMQQKLLRYIASQVKCSKLS